MKGTSCFFSYFLTNKRAKGENPDRISGKTTFKKTTNFKNVTVFLKGTSFFMCFFTKKRAKGEMTEFQEKAHGKKWQFSQNVMVFIKGTSSFFSFFDQKKRVFIPTFRLDYQQQKKITKRNKKSQNVTVFVKGTSYFFSCFLTIIEQWFSQNVTDLTLLTKRNVFLKNTSSFFSFLVDLSIFIIRFIIFV